MLATVHNGRNVLAIPATCLRDNIQTLVWSAAKTLVAGCYAHHTVGLEVGWVVMHHTALVRCIPRPRKCSEIVVDDVARLLAV